MKEKKPKYEPVTGIIKLTRKEGIAAIIVTVAYLASMYFIWG